MKPVQRTLFLLLGSLLILISACSPKPTPSPALTGALSELSGTVDGKQADEAKFHPVVAGDVLQVNGQVQTGGDGRVRIDLSSGTIIRVAPSSLFTLVSNEPAQGGGLVTTLKLELGRIYIILSGGSLDVETPSGVASVRGSYMMVEVDSVTHNVVATCLEGICEAGGIQFTNGQKVTLFYYNPDTGQYRPPLLQDMNDQDFNQWLEDNPDVGSILQQVLASQPSATPVPTATPTPTPEATLPAQSNLAGESTCFNLLAPPDGATLNSGQVTFSWEAQDGAVGYQLVFISPGGAHNTLNSSTTSITNYINILPTGGTYSWSVTALDANGQSICTSDSFSFNKPESPTLVPVEPTKQDEQCTWKDAQWQYPNQPCYCNYDMNRLPLYCQYGYLP